MLFRHSLPKKADIFIKSKNAKSYSSYYKSFKTLKIGGIIMSSVVLFLGAVVFLVPGQQASKLIAPEMAASGTSVNPNANWWANQNWNGNRGNDTDTNADVPNNVNNHVNTHLNLHN